jgi:hypothetical protein
MRFTMLGGLCFEKKTGHQGYCNYGAILLLMGDDRAKALRYRESMGQCSMSKLCFELYSMISRFSQKPPWKRVTMSVSTCDAVAA